MNGTIQAPTRGDGLKASWGSAVANGINALAPMSPSEMLVRDGAGGVGCDPLPKNRRDRRSNVADIGRFRIDSIEYDEDEATYTLTFGNCYYRCGGKTYELEVTEDGNENVLSIDESELPAIVALKVRLTESEPSAEIEKYSDLSELKEEEADADYFIAPLYALDESCSKTCDFRIGPDAAIFEFSESQTSQSA